MVDIAIDKLKTSKLILFAISTAIVAFTWSCNPFAPSLSNDESIAPIVTDQMTIEGVFENFRYSYTFKDTLVYGNLLNDDFTFSYYNTEKSVNVSWGREQDMSTTARMFNGTQSIDLIWNGTIPFSTDSLEREISRSFTLKIVISANDDMTAQGWASFLLKRPSTDKPWRISVWRDLNSSK